MSGNTEEVINQVIHTALDYGITIIDTSRGYMDSETLIGEVMKTRRSDCMLASKTMSREKDAAMADVEESLRAFLHDQGCWTRQRPRLEYGLRLCATIWRTGNDSQCAG